MAKRSSLRASDADRDQVAERLRRAAAEGRLLAHELEERLATALRAQTYGELDAVVLDLPGGPLTRSGRRQARTRDLARAHPVGAVAILVAVTLVMLVTAAIVIAGLFAFSGVWVVFAFLMFARRGRWHGPPGYAHRRGRYAGR